MKHVLLILSLALVGGAATVQAQAYGLAGKYTSFETTNKGPSIAALDGRIYMAWKGDGNQLLNVMVSHDGGRQFGHKLTSGDTSGSAPSLAAFRGRLYMAWRGVGNDQLNVAQVALDAAGNPRGLVRKFTGQDTTTSAPSLISERNRGLFIAWRGDGNDELNFAKVEVR